MRKRILFIYNKSALSNYNSDIHSGWIKEVSADYDIKWWGKGFGETGIKNLVKVCLKWKPNYIYLTVRKRYQNWLPDLSGISIPKIYVECDTWRYSSEDSWYDQFDSLYCRQPWWGESSMIYSEKMGSKNKFLTSLEKERTWKNVKLFRWSVSESNIKEVDNETRKGVSFIGGFRSRTGAYEYRIHLHEQLKDSVLFLPKPGLILDSVSYWNALRKSSALICPTESNYGDFIPTKIFEYAASGAAILTNCDLERYNMKDLDNVVIKYKDLDDLKSKLDMDFSHYYGKSQNVIKNHVHRIRYKELFE